MAHGPDSLSPTLGLFAAAAFRLTPSANRVIGASQNVRYSLPVIAVLHSELVAMQRADAPRGGDPLPFRNELALDAVTYSYPGTDTPVLRGVTLVFPRANSAGSICTTGSGKSTFVDVVLGLLTHERGAVLADGVDIQTNQRGWQDQIGYVPRAIFLTDDTLRRIVAFGLADEEIDDQAVWRAIRAAQLELCANDFPAGLETGVSARGAYLSGGQRQRIGIARALYHDPPVLVLD
jgi:ABC-type multidrug transport system fused ATPase/permease subunit